MMSPPTVRRVTGFISLATPKRAEVSTFTLLSFQRPRPGSGLLTKKASAQKALQKSILAVSGFARRALQMSRGWTRTCAAVAGSRRMVAEVDPLSRNAKPDELPLSDL